MQAHPQALPGHHADHHHGDHDHHGRAPGLMGWFTTTNHKDIGTMYLWFSFIMFLVGGAMSLVIRAELFSPGLQYVSPEFYNQMLTSSTTSSWCARRAAPRCRPRSTRTR